jgi:threonine/homoserine/homoserine lactone efflux protein
VPTAQTIALFMSAGLALNLTPGPDMLFVAAQGTGGGRRAGAGYLLYLGGRALLRPQPLGEAAAPARSRGSAMLFFLAFVPQFVGPRRGPAAGQIVVLGMLFNTTALMVNATVGWLASRATDWIRVRPGRARTLQRVTGGVFVALGLRLALLERH